MNIISNLQRIRVLSKGEEKLMIQPCISLFKRTYGNKCHQTQHNMMVPIKLKSVLQVFHCSGTGFNSGLWGIGL